MPDDSRTATEKEAEAIKRIREEIDGGKTSPEFQLFADSLQKALTVPKEKKTKEPEHKASE
ncbi:MAG TPA: hypothetical protein VKU00_26625 [Chthonomonadaceae bacterium]|nr:hypothetical protein [Chthonomonadaceae bacterium]